MNPDKNQNLYQNNYFPIKDASEHTLGFSKD